MLNADAMLNLDLNVAVSVGIDHAFFDIYPNHTLTCGHQLVQMKNEP